VAVKHPDYKKIVEQIYHRVVEKLGPYGILVEHTEPETSPRSSDVSEFTLKIPEQDKSKPGIYQELIVHVTAQDAWQIQQDAKNLDCLPQAWAHLRRLGAGPVRQRPAPAGRRRRLAPRRDAPRRLLRRVTP
jgi:hypothetical protein